MERRKILFREPVLIALDSLRSHMLRSFLTLLGIIISVATLIGVVSVFVGMRIYVAERVANFGANTYYVTRYGIITNAKDFLEARRRNKKFTMEDYEYLRDHLTLAEEVGALDGNSADVRAGRQDLEDVSVRGVTASMVNIFRETVAAGRYITEADYHSRTMVAFVGTDVTDRLFPQVDPIGKTLYIRSLPFEIVGVAEKVGSVLGQSQDNFVNIPLTTYLKIFGHGPPGDGGISLGIHYLSPAVREQSKDETRVLLRTRRQLKLNDKDNFGIIESEGIVDLYDQIFGGLTGAFIGVVSVFLVVGGIVIMNIMLASVTERTREIGIRKAIGARRQDILLQFLIEASVLAAIGGLLGVLFGMGISQLVAATTPVPVRTPLFIIVLSLVVATSIGLFFGVYPARKAAQCDPVVALQME